MCIAARRTRGRIIGTHKPNSIHYYQLAAEWNQGKISCRQTRVSFPMHGQHCIRWQSEGHAQFEGAALSFVSSTDTGGTSATLQSNISDMYRHVVYDRSYCSHLTVLTWIRWRRILLVLIDNCSVLGKDGKRYKRLTSSLYLLKRECSGSCRRGARVLIATIAIA